MTKGNQGREELTVGLGVKYQPPSPCKGPFSIESHGGGESCEGAKVSISAMTLGYLELITVY